MEIDEIVQQQLTSIADSARGAVGADYAIVICTAKDQKKPDGWTTGMGIAGSQGVDMKDVLTNLMVTVGGLLNDTTGGKIRLLIGHGDQISEIGQATDFKKIHVDRP